MAFILKKQDTPDTLSSRWVEVQPGFRVKVGSGANPSYMSAYNLIVRHVSAFAAAAGVGTEAFSVLDGSAGAVIPDVDLLYFELTAKHLLLDWEGVAEAEDPNTPAQYTPARGVALLIQEPSLYLLINNTASAIAKREEEVVAESVEKPLPRTDGQPSGRAKKTNESAK